MKLEYVSEGLAEVRVNDVLFSIIDDGDENEIGIAVEGENDCVSILDLERIITEAKKMLKRY